MAVWDDTPLNPDDFVVIDGKQIHKDMVKRALAIAKLVEALHGQMGHRYIDPPVF